MEAEKIYCFQTHLVAVPLRLSQSTCYLDVTHQIHPRSFDSKLSQLLESSQ